MSMLSPKRSKFRKSHKGNLKGRAKGGNEVSFGDYGLQVTSPGWLTARQIEAARVAISRSVKKLGKIYVRVFPDHPFTKKPFHRAHHKLTVKTQLIARELVI